ncbi:MAG: ABC transporter ATP-binding protein [Promethearchaeota archaeon]
MTQNQKNLNSPVISLKNVSRVYQMGEHEIWALKDMDLNVFPSELIVVLGPSGSGKTTLLNLIGGIDTPTRGTLEVAGLKLTKKVDLTRFRREKVSHIFQFFNLIPTLTALENVEYVLELEKGLSRKDRRERARKCLDFVDLLDRADHFPVQCSGGEQQRISVARAIAKKPPIILADEPTGELDYETGKRILELLRIQSDDHGRTVLVVTHNSEIAKISDRVIRLRSGKISEIIDNKNSKVPVSAISW